MKAIALFSITQLESGRARNGIQGCLTPESEILTTVVYHLR